MYQNKTSNITSIKQNIFKVRNDHQLEYFSIYEMYQGQYLKHGYTTKQWSIHEIHVSKHKKEKRPFKPSAFPTFLLFSNTS